MHVGAFLGYARDSWDNTRKLRRLLQPGYCGFAPLGEEGAWSWRLEQARLVGVWVVGMGLAQQKAGPSG